MRIKLTLLLTVVAATVYAQTFTEKLTKEFAFANKTANNTVVIANVNGGVQLKGYAGDKVIIEAEKTIRAKTEAALATGKERVVLGYRDLADTILIYIDGLCPTFSNRCNGKGGWGYNWRNCEGNDGWVDGGSFEFVINFTVQVPEGVNVVVSTVNNGDVAVQNVKGSIVADNVNGSISLDQLKGSVVAHTINGDLNLNYISNPMQDCKFYTLNGDINADFSRGLAANVSFESFNGEFFSNVDDMELMPLKVEEAKNKEGVRYKVTGNRYKVRSGGPTLDFETFNGNVYLKEAK